MERKNTVTGLILFAVLFIACSSPKDHPLPKTTADSSRLSKFEPANGKVILFLGQELESIGGTEHYTDGYFDHFPPAGGFTQYTNFLNGISSFGYKHRGLDGLTTLDNWGDGPESMAITVSAPKLKKSCLAIVLDISQGNDRITAEGGFDDLIYTLGNWLKNLGDRPVFLRIGYEFDGFEWNHYQKEFYIPAWRRIRNKLDSMGVNNVAYVWQSKGAGANRDTMDAFYPGDKYVDWVAYSFFIPADANHPMIQFAREHKNLCLLQNPVRYFWIQKGFANNWILQKRKMQKGPGRIGSLFILKRSETTRTSSRPFIISMRPGNQGPCGKTIFTLRI